MKRLQHLLLLLLALATMACDGGDRDRIPAAAVRVEFASQAMWNQYGVSGSFIHRQFILSSPPDFPTPSHRLPATEASCS